MQLCPFPFSAHPHETCSYSSSGTIVPTRWHHRATQASRVPSDGRQADWHGLCMEASPLRRTGTSDGRRHDGCMDARLARNMLVARRCQTEWHQGAWANACVGKRCKSVTRCALWQYTSNGRRKGKSGKKPNENGIWRAGTPNATMHCNRHGIPHGGFKVG